MPSKRSLLLSMQKERTLEEMCRTFKNLNEVFEEEEGCEVDSDQGFLGSTDVNEINSSYQS